MKEVFEALFTEILGPLVLGLLIFTIGGMGLLMVARFLIWFAFLLFGGS